MRGLLGLMIISLASASCGEDKKEEKTEAVAVTESIPVTHSLAGCRQMVIAKDTAYMSLQEAGDSLYGPLEYKRFEKDSNKGIVRLIKNNDRAEGWYNFQSEGKNTVRQVIFKLSGDSLSEAYGDITLKGDTAMFKYPQSLQYEEKHSFVKTNCK